MTMHIHFITITPLCQDKFIFAFVSLLSSFFRLQIEDNSEMSSMKPKNREKVRGMKEANPNRKSRKVHSERRKNKDGGLTTSHFSVRTFNGFLFEYNECAVLVLSRLRTRFFR